MPLSFHYFALFIYFCHAHCAKVSEKATNGLPCLPTAAITGRVKDEGPFFQGATVVPFLPVSDLGPLCFEAMHYVIIMELLSQNKF